MRRHGSYQHLIHLIFLLTWYQPTFAILECFSCSGVTDLSSCITKTTCKSGQICYNNKTNTGQQTYDLGCASIQDCGIHGNVPSTIVGRDLSERQATLCHKCCATNLCNRNLCGHTDVFTDCKDIMRTRGSPKSGVYTVNLWKSKRTINVYCDMDTDNGGWTVIQNRFDGSVDFYKNFTMYEQGFGDLSTEFWLGLRDIQEMSSEGLTDLRIELEAVNGSKGFETFERFSLSAGPSYTLHLGSTLAASRVRNKYLSESVGPYHNGQAFSTYDHDVDKFAANCALKYHGGWWYNSCYYANLNGPYITPGLWTEKSIRYKSFFDYRSLKSCRMMIRRR